MEDLSEKEQLDAMRAWWSENGKFVIGGILVGIITIFGINEWRTTKADAEIAASTIYEDVMFGAGSGDIDLAVEAATKLFADYGDTPYAALSRLALARLYMDNARDQDAADALTALLDATPDKEIASVARLRLGKILLYQGKAEEVVGLLGSQPEGAFSARFSELLGDAYVELERYAEAEDAYMAALADSTQSQTLDTALIQLKINDLPELAGGAATEGLIGGEAEAGATEEAPEDTAAEELLTEDAAAEPEPGTE